MNTSFANTSEEQFKPFTAGPSADRVGREQLDRAAFSKGLQPASEPPPLTMELLRENPEIVARAAIAKGSDVDLTAVLNADSAGRAALIACEQKRREANECAQAAQRILAASGKDSDAFREIRERGAKIKEEITELSKRSQQYAADRDEKFSWIPNLHAPEVPLGGAGANLVLRQTELPAFDFTPRDHVAIGSAQGWLDFEGGARVAGRGFYFLKGELYLLRQTIALLMLSNLASQGFVPATTPVFAGRATLFGTGYLPWAQKDNFVVNDGSGLAAIGTSEQPLLGQFLDCIVPERKLPILLAADTQCFRTEISSGGADAQGMKRVHQFGKVEQIIICKPEETRYWHERALANEEDLLRFLEIPHRTVLLSTGDMGFAGYKKYDTEAWLPAKREFMELTSNTNFRDFQARRLKLRYRGEASGKNEFPHTISATGFSDRLLIAFLENHQQPDGTVRIPEKLQAYFGGRSSIGRPIS